MFILSDPESGIFLVLGWKTGVQIVGFNQAERETARKERRVLRATAAEAPHVAQAHCPRFAMPTVSVKRDLLFQALGRTYSECPPRGLGSVPGAACLARQKVVLAAFVPPRGVWPCAAGVCRGALKPGWAEVGSQNQLCGGCHCIIRRGRDLRVIHSVTAPSTSLARTLVSGHRPGRMPWAAVPVRAALGNQIDSERETLVNDVGSLCSPGCLRTCRLQPVECWDSKRWPPSPAFALFSVDWVPVAC